MKQKVKQSRWFMSGSRGQGGGGSPGQSDKKKALTFFFAFFLVLSLFYRSQMVNFKAIYHFSRFQRGSNIFQGGPTFSRGVGWSNCLFPIESHKTCDFPGGTDPLPPPPPPLDPHLWFPIVSASYNIDPPETNMHFISNWSIFRMWLRRFVMSP